MVFAEIDRRGLLGGRFLFCAGVGLQGHIQHTLFALIELRFGNQSLVSERFQKRHAFDHIDLAALLRRSPAHSGQFLLVFRIVGVKPQGHGERRPGIFYFSLLQKNLAPCVMQHRIIRQRF